MMNLTPTPQHATPKGAIQWDLSSNAIRMHSSDLPLTQSAFENASGNGTKGREMVWQRADPGPIADLLAAHPDFSVLLYNESVTVRSLIRSVIVSFGVTNIKETHHSIDAINALKEGVPDLAIIDDDTVSNGGLALLRYLRQSPQSPAPGLPVIMMTCASSPSRIFDIRNAGASEILAKPFAPAALAARIDTTVRNQRPFVRTPSFSGPDRRRQQRPFEGVDRRAASCPDVPDVDDENIYWIQ